MALINSMKINWRNLTKNETSWKPLELCETRIKKERLDVLKYNVVFGVRDLVNDTDRSTTCRSSFRASPLQRRIQKIKVLSKTRVSPDNCLKISDKKLKTFTFFNTKQKKSTTKHHWHPKKMDLLPEKSTVILFWEALI